jgi:hypothetical protein
MSRTAPSATGTRSNLDAHDIVQKFYSIPLARALLVNSAWSAVKANHKETSSTKAELNEVYRLWARTLTQEVLPFVKVCDLVQPPPHSRSLPLHSTCTPG